MQEHEGSVAGVATGGAESAEEIVRHPKYGKRVNARDPSRQRCINIEEEGLSITTIEREIARMKGAIERQTHKYQPPKKGTREEVIVAIFRASSSEDLLPHEEERLRQAVRYALEHNEPIPIGIMWALPGMARCRYKFAEPVNLPRFGDLWFGWWFDCLCTKVRAVHAPGIQVIVADEAPMCRLLGISESDVQLRRACVQEVFRQTPCVQIVELPDYDGAADVEVPEPAPELVYAILVSMEWEPELPVDTFGPLYLSAAKDLEAIRAGLPPGTWELARKTRIACDRIAAARKKHGLFEAYFRGAPYIDACITRKGRWTPSIWGRGRGASFPFHGGSFVEANTNGRMVVTCSPERRLEEGGFRPVKIDASEFRAFVPPEMTLPEGQYTFYWVKSA